MRVRRSKRFNSGQVRMGYGVNKSVNLGKSPKIEPKRINYTLDKSLILKNQRRSK